MNTVQKIAAIYLLSVLVLTWGYLIGRHEVFPFQYIKTLEDFIAGDNLAPETSTKDKVINELGIKPTHFIYPSPTKARDKATPLMVEQLNKRRDPPMTYTKQNHTKGYRAVFGAIDFVDNFWGGLLINDQSEVIHSWKLSTEQLPNNSKADYLKNLYGLALLPDGSIIFTMQEEGGGIIKVDACGNTIWTLEGSFHHTVSLSEDNRYFWTYMGNQMAMHHKLAKVSTDSGEILHVIDMKDVFNKNPYIHIFNLQNHLKSMNDWLDISHGNDIDELYSSQADQYPDFESGDLLLSYRTHNLVFVIDPNTHKLKWWRIGTSDRQHDPDWENGVITVLGNNSVGARKGSSDIVSIDTRALKHKVIVNGDDYGFYTSINGRQQLTDFNTRIITSSTQGWIFEVDEAGEVVFSFLNTYDNDKYTSLHVSEAFRLRDNFFTEKFWDNCQ